MMEPLVPRAELVEEAARCKAEVVPEGRPVAADLTHRRLGAEVVGRRVWRERRRSCWPKHSFRQKTSPAHNQRKIAGRIAKAKSNNSITYSRFKRTDLLLLI